MGTPFCTKNRQGLLFKNRLELNDRNKGNLGYRVALLYLKRDNGMVDKNDHDFFF